VRGHSCWCAREEWHSTSQPLPTSPPRGLVSACPPLTLAADRPWSALEGDPNKVSRPSSSCVDSDYDTHDAHCLDILADGQSRVGLGYHPAAASSWFKVIRGHRAFLHALTFAADDARNEHAARITRLPPGLLRGRSRRGSNGRGLWESKLRELIDRRKSGSVLLRYSRGSIASTGR